MSLQDLLLPDREWEPNGWDASEDWLQPYHTPLQPRNPYGSVFSFYMVGMYKNPLLVLSLEYI